MNIILFFASPTTILKPQNKHYLKRWPLCHFFILLLAISAIILPPSVSAQDTLQDPLKLALEKRAQKFQARYGIPLMAPNINREEGVLRFTGISPEEYKDLEQYLQLFEEEILKYPPSFFTARDVRGIALVKYLFFDGRPAQGIYFSNDHVMFFDVIRKNENKAAQRHSIHHELFHMMAMQTPGYTPLKDDLWTSWNNPGFRYGKRPHLTQATNPYNHFAPHEPGFVTYYAMTSVEEDKAEVFACLMQASHKKLIEKWMIKDQILLKKIHTIKAFVQYYCPEMNEGYWHSIR